MWRELFAYSWICFSFRVYYCLPCSLPIIPTDFLPYKNSIDQVQMYRVTVAVVHSAVVTN